jgi:hypothetical protein
MRDKLVLTEKVSKSYAVNSLEICSAAGPKNKRSHSDGNTPDALCSKTSAKENHFLASQCRTAERTVNHCRKYRTDIENRGLSAPLQAECCRACVMEHLNYMYILKRLNAHLRCVCELRIYLPGPQASGPTKKIKNLVFSHVATTSPNRMCSALAEFNGLAVRESKVRQGAPQRLQDLSLPINLPVPSSGWLK